MKKWESGALAVILVSEHYANINRIVQLRESIIIGEHNKAGWIVYDGQLFRGYGTAINESGGISGGFMLDSPLLGIEQWKMRLLDDNDLTEEDAEGIRYVVSAET